MSWIKEGEWSELVFILSVGKCAREWALPGGVVSRILEMSRKLIWIVVHSCGWLWEGCWGEGSWNYKGVELGSHTKKPVLNLIGGEVLFDCRNREVAWAAVHWALHWAPVVTVWSTQSLAKKLSQLCRRVGTRLLGARMSGVMERMGQIWEILEETLVEVIFV